MEHIQHMHQEKGKTSGEDIFLAVLYTLLACGMYYFHDEYIDLGIHFMYKFVLAVLIAALSFLIFLVRTDLRRGGSLGAVQGLLRRKGGGQQRQEHDGGEQSCQQAFCFFHSSFFLS